jgi:hypothetical protein
MSPINVPGWNLINLLSIWPEEFINAVVPVVET